jgi:hypothetical protein
MTEDQMRDLVKECGLDWQRGYMPLFDGDPTNRYAVLIEAALDSEAEDCALVCEDFDACSPQYIARAIRARIAGRKGGAQP